MDCELDAATLSDEELTILVQNMETQEDGAGPSEPANVDMETQQFDAGPSQPREDTGNDSEDEAVLQHRKRKSRRLESSDEEEDVHDEAEQETAVIETGNTRPEPEDDTQPSSSEKNRNTDSEESGSCEGSDSEDPQSDYDSSASNSSSAHEVALLGYAKRIRGRSPEFDHHLAHIVNEQSPSKRKKRNTGVKRKRRTTKSRQKAAKRTQNGCSTAGAVNNGSEAEGVDSNSESESIPSHGREDVEDYSGEAQFVSIHKIRINNSDCSEEEYIQNIVSKYNKTHSKTQYEEEPVVKFPKISDEDLKYFDGEDFRIKIFVQECWQKIGLLSAYGIPKESGRVRSLIFYFRSEEIFALTTDQAWTVVQSDSDYFFPMQIAARLLSEKGQLEVTYKPLLGNEVTTKRVMKEHQQASPFDLLRITVSIVADLRENCSLTRLSPFSGASRTKVEARLAGVRIKKRLDVSDFGSILSHFSIIANNLPTYVVGTQTPEEPLDQRELDTDAHRTELARIPIEMKASLDKHLCQLILDALKDSEKIDKLYNFSICHKHWEDYTRASQYSLYHNRTECKKFYTMPSLKDIIDNLPFDNMKMNAERRRANNPISERSTINEELIVEMGNIRLAFSNPKGVVKREKLVSCLEGPLWWPADGQVYWLVMSQWCCVRDTYLLMVHTEFLRMLERLLREDQDGFLSRPFVIDRVNQTEDPIPAYIRGYEGVHGFFPWKDTVEGDKLFDMIYVDRKKHIYLYYLTQSINHDLLFTGKRITKHTLGIQSACRRTEKKEQDPAYRALKSFYEEHGAVISLYFRTFQAFREALGKSSVIYAMGQEQLTPNVEETSLEKESQLETMVSVADVDAVLENNNIDEAWAKSIHDGLVQVQYLQSTGSITSKLLICTKETFQLNLQLDCLGPSMDDTNNFVFEKIVRNYKSSSGYNTFLLKNVFWMIEKDLNEKGSKFFICEIPRN